MKCKTCENETEAVVNIKFKAVPLCSNCALTIAIQTVTYHLSGDFNRDLTKLVVRNPDEVLE